jgi:GT2 family glycosyltransferase/glycosyltransferase involved in cell wall biosynthesis
LSDISESGGPKALIFTSHLMSMSSWARLAVDLARSLSRVMPTEIASATPLSPQVLEWFRSDRDSHPLEIVPFESGMAAQYDLLWNVDVNTYAEPLAKRNLAWVIAPHYNNVPAEEFELFAVSQYVQKQAEHFWKRICQRLYPRAWGETVSLEKEKIILHLSRFVRPNELVDPAHQIAIEQFKKLCAEDEKWNWQLVLLGGLVPGHGSYLDEIQAAALGSNIKIVPNADQSTLNNYLRVASLLWNTSGLCVPNSPLAKSLFPSSNAEAAAAGVVPIACDNGSNSEFIIHGYNGFLADAPDQFADITANLAKANSIWSMLSQRAQATSQGWVSEQVFDDQVRAVLEGRPSSKPPVPRWLDSAPGQDNVCAIITAHNNVEMTLKCLEQLKQMNPAVRTILVDSGSTDDMSAIKDMVESCGGVFIRLDSNDGMGAAWTAAKPHCDRPYILLMHNDVFPLLGGDWLDVLLAEMNDEAVGIAGGKLNKPDGFTVQFAGWQFSPDNGGVFYHIGDGQLDEPRFSQRQLVIGVSSACMLIRKELFEPDPKYHLVYGDLDLCVKARKQNFHVIFQPASVLIHIDGSTRKLRGDAADIVRSDRERFFASIPDVTQVGTV